MKIQDDSHFTKINLLGLLHVVVVVDVDSRVALARLKCQTLLLEEIKMMITATTTTMKTVMLFFSLGFGAFALVEFYENLKLMVQVTPTFFSLSPVTFVSNCFSSLQKRSLSQVAGENETGGLELFYFIHIRYS